MRLYNYLNEDKDKLRRFTESFFKEFGDAYMSDDFIWRGHKDKIETHKTKKRRKKRKPRLVQKELHEYLDNISEDLFGWKVRSTGIFCGDYGLASEGGTPYIFVPLGEYRYIGTKDYMDVYDLYDRFTDTSTGPEEVVKDQQKDIKNDLYKMYKEGYSTTGLPKAVEQASPFEAIFDADYYLLINTDHGETMKEQLLK